MSGKYKPRNTPEAIRRRRLKELRDRGLKLCPKCEEVLPRTEEVWGKGIKASWCKKCYNVSRLGCKDVNTKRAKLRKLNQQLEAEGLRFCPICEEKKPRTLEFFSKKTQNKGDGLNTYCKECEARKHKERYAKKIKDPEYRKKLNEYNLRYYYENPERYKERTKRWRQGTGRAKSRATVQNYRAKKSKASPPWLSDSQYNEMRVIYLKARKLEKKTGKKYHVDHIAPLRGETICGLHVPWNLEPLTAAANISKANRYDQKRLDSEQLAAAQYACQNWRGLRTN